MCGICGLAYSDQRLGDAELLRVMSDAIRHRGPDSEGTYIAEGIGLAMRRLAIIDVQGGDQPISNEDESMWITLNGEIYNYAEMRRALEARGHKFKTHSDTECILHYYEDEGEACVDHLRGMFAFALWDGKKRRLLLARDRLGKKPIHYAIQNGCLYFCSELGALLRALPIQPDVDPEALDLFLSLQYIPEPRTAFCGVFKLPAAHVLTWESGILNIRRYWDYSPEPKIKAGEAQLAEELRDRLREAVRIRLMSEVPLGVHLSGGLDSSIVVSLMAELCDAPVQTFAVGFAEQGYSELPLARAVATRYGTDHHEFMLRYDDLPATLELVVQHIGEPFADASAIPLYHLARLTRETVTVALNGDGGDEALAGYQRYWLDPLANAYLRAPHWLTHRAIPAVAGRLRDDMTRPTGQGLVDGLKRLERLPNVDPRASILRWSSHFSEVERKSLWKREFWRAFDARAAEGILVNAYDRASGSALDRTLYADVHTYLPGDLLVKADRMTMAASLEARSPFLDQEIIAWTARLPDATKVRGNRGKHLLRRAFASALPAEVLRHPKQGFGIPLGAWFRGPLQKWSRELLLGTGRPLAPWFEEAPIRMMLDEHIAGTSDHGKRLYSLAMMAAWAASLRA
ncbi:MAG TPA: asparagine synthase (glutamine-hydrolyzing) [Anaerolineales bacterium]|nr:asparagine synthase (glutamine-hydrolyzing) [Anaerolineales bacterium]